MDHSKYSSKLVVVSEIAKLLSQINADKPSSVEDMNLRVGKVKKPIEEDILNTLDQLEESLQASLSSSLKFQDEADGLMRWLSKMEIALKSQSPLSADENIAKRQKTEHAYLTDDVARYFSFYIETRQYLYIEHSKKKRQLFQRFDTGED